MAGFRLVEAGIAGGGPLTLPTVYATTDDARQAAEAMLEALEDRPHRRPFAYRIVDVETGELVDTVRPPSDWDPDPFPPGLWDTGPGDGPAAGSPLAEAEPPPPAPQ